MPAITKVRTVLLSTPYADADDPEIKESFPNGPKRTIGMVELTLDDGTTGIGEGYLAVFAPMVFKSIVDLLDPYLVGKDAFDIPRRIADMRSVCDYWSLQGAARHVISAVEIALWDAMGKVKGQPVHALLGTAKDDSLQIYGSGGCCDNKDAFVREMELLNGKGIELYKIRSVKQDLKRTAWVLEEAAARGIKVGVDMCQNLADPPQSVDDAAGFIEGVAALTDVPMIFVEEALGPDAPENFRALRDRIDVPVYGGEIITTPKEMIERLQAGCYDGVQPDASVIGGISAVMDIFAAAKPENVRVIVHAWGGPAAIMASYHAAFAGHGDLVEWPMLYHPLTDDMIGDRAPIVAGRLTRPDSPGIGVELTPEIEARYPFDPSAVYSCMLAEYGPPPESYWTR
ncbi:mandelate racemase/muconate lactonizing enzyme family protein [Psychromarinibacter halotolerans]|uniref:Mandelate racemase/muconate lactonizing enzyme family protein n=1 Tax=Psychromarinibacter halotolerans TaxID=1775175 RepID=A0ABV7GW13_9RHOB|nr:mandelate racemase/muconate lactonizing enzyme family protein [Psychromarinibacter halotolerans]MDF0597647.1 mandelate racemase/muconate lactonizing enzyme family protein [Psychromarinibacter halotolerans]